MEARTFVVERPPRNGVDLIDVSARGRAERYLRGTTPHTIFTWWARRPFSAITDLFQAHVPASATGPLRVLDPFSGGATIPLVAASRGVQVWALDNNELAAFINHALLNLSQVPGDLPSLVRERGHRLLSRLSEETADWYSDRPDGTIAYLWTMSITCPTCDGRFPLSKRPWLARRPGKQILSNVTLDRETRSFGVSVVEGGEPSPTAWRGSRLTCPFCEERIARESLVSALASTGRMEPVAAVYVSAGGKKYRPAGGADDQQVETLEGEIGRDLLTLGQPLPAIRIPAWSGIANPALYGLSSVHDLFSPRQLAVIVRLARLLREEHEEARTVLGEEQAEAVTAFLSALIDQLADWNSRLSMWIPQNEQVGRALSGPGLPMLWDFAEIDPVSTAPANLWSKLTRITNGLSTIPRFSETPTVTLGDARCLPFADGSFDAVITDPPYYDNIGYHLLADVIYGWKRLALKDVFPAFFSAPGTNADRELSALKARHGSQAEAHAYYTNGLGLSLAEAIRVVKPGGKLVLAFGHSSIDGWLSLLDSVRYARLEIEEIWDLRVERKHRPRGVNSHSAETSFLFVCRAATRPMQFVDEALARKELRELLRDESSRLGARGMPPDHIASSLVAAGIRYLSRTDVGTADVTSSADLVRLVELEVSELVPDFQLSRR